MSEAPTIEVIEMTLPEPKLMKRWQGIPSSHFEGVLQAQRGGRGTPRTPRNRLDAE